MARLAKWQNRPTTWRGSVKVLRSAEVYPKLVIADTDPPGSWTHREALGGNQPAPLVE